MNTVRYTFSLLFARIALLGLAATPTLLHAQQVFWDPDHGTLGVGKAFELTLVFDNCTPDGAISLPDVDGLDFGNPSMTSQTNMMNFRVQRRYLVTYPATATREGEITVPSFSVATSEGRYTVPEAHFASGTAGVGQSGVAITDIIKSELRLSRSTVWVGEVVDAEYVIASSPRYSATLATEPAWSPDNLVREPFGEAERTSMVVNGEQWSGLLFRTRFIATTAGTFTLDPVELRINVQTGPRTGFFGFSQPQVERFSVASPPRELVVRPLPEPVPSGFNGAIGKFEFESKVVPDTAQVGNPITWTLTLHGAGNWPSNLALPEREVSADFEVVQPEVQQTMDDGRLFNGSLTEDAVLIPTKSGTYALGPVTFTYFDTATGKYDTTSVPPVEITIQPPAGNSNRAAPPQPAGGPATAPNAGSPGAESRNSTTEAPLPRNVLTPTALPREPIPTGGTGVAPSGVAPIWWFAVALLPPALGWLILAWRQLLRTDLSRERKAAHKTARKHIQDLLRNKRLPQTSDLLTWRSAVARLWRISRAAPTREDVARAIAVLGRESEIDAWLSLWQETDAHLFGSHSTLPPDWAERAEKALQEIRIGRSAPFFPLRRRYWLPGFAMATVIGLFVATTFDVYSATDRASEAYQTGDFATARELWGMQLDQNPQDWSLRNNLGLAWAQEDHWAEASAQWTAAFLLRPRDPTIRANLRLALTRLGGMDPAVRRILSGAAVDRAATWLSPGEWGYVFFVGAVLFASGLLAAVVGMYRRVRMRRWRHFGFGLILCGTIATLAALAAQWRYGPLAKPTAALVTTPTQLCSIPTELAEAQQTAPVAPGTVVVITKSFLNWDQVQIGASANGWLRRETAEPFYRRPAMPDPQGADEIQEPSPAAASAAATVLATRPASVGQVPISKSSR